MWTEAMQQAQPDQQQYRFGQKLANPDKRVRDKTVKVLAKFLSNKAMPDLEYEKLWKGLFYCMWLADKVPIQLELAERMAALVHAPPQSETLRFLKAFWTTMVREWHGIDHLRLDKFYSLVRAFIRDSFMCLQRRQWAPNKVSSYASLLASLPLHPSNEVVPSSIRFHVADIYWQELMKACDGGAQLSPEISVAIIEPFLQLLAQTENKPTFERIKATVFDPLLTTGRVNAITRDDEVPVAPEGDVREILDLSQLPARMFSLASNKNTQDKFRRQLYDLHKQLKMALLSSGSTSQITHVSSEEKEEAKEAAPSKAVKKQKRAAEPAEDNDVPRKRTLSESESAPNKKHKGPAEQAIVNGHADASHEKKPSQKQAQQPQKAAVESKQPAKQPPKQAQSAMEASPAKPMTKQPAKQPAKQAKPTMDASPAKQASPEKPAHIAKEQNVTPSSPAAKQTPSLTSQTRPSTPARANAVVLANQLLTEMEAVISPAPSPKPILRSANSTPSSTKKKVILSLWNNKVKEFEKTLPPSSVSNPSTPTASPPAHRTRHAMAVKVSTTAPQPNRAVASAAHAKAAHASATPQRGNGRKRAAEFF